MADKPTMPMALSVLAGILILIGGALIAFDNSAISFFGYLANGGASGTNVTIVGVVGVIMGLVVILGGIMISSKPNKAKMWGAVVVVLSILSWFTAVGGLVVGFLLGLAGGVMAIRFKPSTASGAMSPAPMMSSTPMGSASTSSMGMTCKNCGASIPAGASRCPSCGANL